MRSNTIVTKYTKSFQSNISPHKNENIFSLVQEYCKLSMLIQPSLEDVNRLAAILELAEYDEELNSLLNDADDLLAYELNLCNL